MHILQPQAVSICIFCSNKASKLRIYLKALIPLEHLSVIFFLKPKGESRPGVPPRSAPPPVHLRNNPQFVLTRDLREQWVLPQLRQYLYFCTSKARKLSTCAMYSASSRPCSANARDQKATQRRQYLYFSTSKASKLRTCSAKARARSK
jgi:hypothetical protein